MSKTKATLNPTLPPITLLLHEYQVMLLIRALMQYASADEDEGQDCKMLLDILELLVMPITKP